MDQWHKLQFLRANDSFDYVVVVIVLQVNKVLVRSDKRIVTKLGL